MSDLGNLIVPCETPVRSSLLTPASPLVQDTNICLVYIQAGLAPAFPQLKLKSDHRCLLKIPLPSGLSPNVSTIYKSCFDLTLLYFPASLPIITQLCLCASSHLNFSPNPKHITHYFFIQQMFIECLTHPGAGNTGDEQNK